jgi:hypothetical protein
MKRAKLVKRDGINTSSKSKLLQGSRRMSKGVFRDNWKTPK